MLNKSEKENTWYHIMYGIKKKIEPIQTSMVIFSNCGEVMGSGVKEYKVSVIRWIWSEDLMDNIVTPVEYSTV